MKRYFDIVGKRQVIELNIEDGSPAAKAEVSDFVPLFKTEIREINKDEYIKLTKEYSKLPELKKL